MIPPRSLSLPLGTALTLSLFSLPAAAESPVHPAEEARPAIEFRLRHPEPRPDRDADIFEEADPGVFERLQAEIAARPKPAASHDPRASFTGVLGSGLRHLPVVGQFANQDFIKGFLILGTGAGLGAAIYLGERDGNPSFTRLGTLGLYPLVIFSLLDAYGTAGHRAESAKQAPADPEVAR